MTIVRLIVAGTRDATFADIPIVLAAIKRWIARNGRPTHVVCGGNAGRKGVDSTLGVDLIGAHLALKAGIKIDFVPADWSLGPSAGPRRNRIMIWAPVHGLVVVRHRWSNGSADVLREAIAKWGADSPLIEDVIIEKRPAVRDARKLDTKAERKKWRAA